MDWQKEAEFVSNSNTRCVEAQRSWLRRRNAEVKQFIENRAIMTMHSLAGEPGLEANHVCIFEITTK